MKTTKILISSIFLVACVAIQAQKVTKKAVDNKGTINTVLDASSTVVTNADNGLTIDNTDPANQKVQLGGNLTENTTITNNGNTLTLDTGGTALNITGLPNGAVTDKVIVQDAATGQLKVVDGGLNITADNGLTKTGNNVQLGGALTQATTITTTATNTLKIAGLEAGDLSSDQVVVTTADGTLKKVSPSSFLTSDAQAFTAAAGQTSYTVTNMPADATRVWVFRNGVKLVEDTDYTAAAGSLTLSPSADWNVIAGDIIEVQWVK